MGRSLLELCMNSTLIDTDETPESRGFRGINWPFWSVLSGSVAVLAAIWWMSVDWTLQHDRFYQVQNDALIRQSTMLARAFDLCVGVWYFAIGSSLASFLNVVAYRMPLGIPITGFSRCPRCREAILGRDNIPVFGWFKLRGRCRQCHLPISFRYPGFELLGGIVGVSFFLFEVMTHAANIPVERISRPNYSMLTGSLDWYAINFSLLHLSMVFHLLAVAMTRWSGQTPPYRLFLAGMVIPLVVCVVEPWLHPVPWNDFSGKIAAEMQPSMAAMSWFLGLVLGIVLGLISWIGLQSWVQRYGSSASPYANRVAWAMSWGLLGAYLGWQAMLMAFAINMLLCCLLQILRWLFGQRSGVSSDPMSWIWLAAMIQIFTWSWQLR